MSIKINEVNILTSYFMHQKGAPNKYAYSLRSTLPFPTRTRWCKAKPNKINTLKQRSAILLPLLKGSVDEESLRLQVKVFGKKVINFTSRHCH